jgi:hypothetical protein
VTQQPTPPPQPPTPHDPASMATVTPPTDAELLRAPKVQDAIAQLIRELPDLLKRKWTSEAELEQSKSTSPKPDGKYLADP